MYKHVNRQRQAYQVDTRCNDIIILRQNDVATSFWRNDNIIITTRVLWDVEISKWNIR